jgi:GxxExxY protein
MPFVYKDIKLDTGYRLDILVENKLIIEIKSVETLAPVHFSQVLTYLKLSELKLGLLINFNTKLLKEGIHRVVNNL